MSYTVAPQQDIRVYVASLPDADVTGDPSELTPELVWRQIVRAMGGDRLDHAAFSYDLAQTGERLRNLQTPLNWSRKVEVRLYTGAEVSPGVDEFVPLFWGDLHLQDGQIVVNQGEAVDVTASIFPYLFGDTCPGVRYYDPYGTDPAARYVDVWEEVEFNPLVDGVIEENMALATVDPGGGAGTYKVWADPESYRTAGAEAIQDLNGEGGKTRWTLAEAVYSLCWFCNPDETWIKNPDRATTISTLGGAIPIDNVKLPPGKHLPFYLDNLLHPYGFDWVVDLSQDPDNAGLSIRRIKVVSRSDGTSKTLKMQDVGGTLELDPAELSYSNCKSFRWRTDIGNVANEVRAVGARKEREIQFPLYRTWPTADDTVSAAGLAKDDPASDYNTANKVNVWRKWVACEAGDYTDFVDADDVMRATPAVTEAYIVTDGFWKVPRRRRAESRLVLDEDGKRRPPLLEWSDDAGTTWRKVTWPHYILSTQIGVLFDDNEPPAELVAAGDDARLRLTCTVADDERVESTAAWSADSPNAAIAAIAIDASDRFFFRDIDTSVTIPTGADTEERDDAALITTFAEHVRDAEKSAEIRAEAVLWNADTEYALGDLITELEGRGIDLNLNDPTGLETRYLQVTEKVYVRIAAGQDTLLRATPQQVPPYYFRKPEGDDRERRRD